MQKRPEISKGKNTIQEDWEKENTAEEKYRDRGFVRFLDENQATAAKFVD